MQWCYTALAVTEYPLHLLTNTFTLTTQLPITPQTPLFILLIFRTISKKVSTMPDTPAGININININNKKMKNSPECVILSIDTHFPSLFFSSSSSASYSPPSSSDLPPLTQTHSPSSSPLRGDLNVYKSKKIIQQGDAGNKEEDNKVVKHLHNHNQYLLDDEFQPLDSARTSFSIALKECQERRSRSEAVAKQLERRRTASMDLNNALSSNNSSSNTSRSNSNCGGNVVSLSPRLTTMKKTSISTRKLGNFPSPGTPSYQGGVNVNKGWSSERVAMPSNGNRRHVGAALLPLNSTNGKMLPSKWEDAERWIFSPVGGDGGGGGGSGRPSSCNQQQVLRRPKSKSGPLGPSGGAYYSMYSPSLPMYEGSNVVSNMVGSPFSAGVMMAEGWSFRAGDGGGRGLGSSIEPSIARSMSAHGCTDLVCHDSLNCSQDKKADVVMEGDTGVSRAVSRRDMATQMSPEGSCHSSRRGSSFSLSTPSILPMVEMQSYNSSKSDIRDVQIDERVTVTRWSKKNRARIAGKGSEDVDEWKLKAIEPRSSAWEVSESVKGLSKARRDEAKIAAWENLQKAKAEAAIRKLEMKLEKKRSSSVDKIMKKLRSAQKKAQEMRSAVTNQALQVSQTNNNAMSIRRTRQFGSLSGCFTCHAF